MPNVRALTQAILAFASLLISSAALAVPILTPTDFTSLGALPGGSFTIDTDANTFGGTVISQGGVIQTNTAQDTNMASISYLTPNDILVLTFDGGATLASGDTISVTGSRSLALLFQGSFSLDGTLSIAGGNGNSPGAGGAAGAGGYAGGNGSGAMGL